MYEPGIESPNRIHFYWFKSCHDCKFCAGQTAGGVLISGLEKRVLFLPAFIVRFFFLRGIEKMKGIRMWHLKWQFPENTVFCIPEFEFFYWSFLPSLIHLHSGGDSADHTCHLQFFLILYEDLKFKTLNPNNECPHCINNHMPEMLLWHWQSSSRGSETSWLQLHIVFTVAYLIEGFSFPFLRAWHPSYQSDGKEMLFFHSPL